MTALEKIQPYAKAVVAFIAPGVTALVAAVQDASQGGSQITGPEWIGIAAACILTSGAVFAVPNKDPRARHQDESVQPPDVRGIYRHDRPAGGRKADAAYHGKGDPEKPDGIWDGI